MINKSIYIVLSFFNFAFLCYVIGFEKSLKVAPYYFGVLLNQFFLVKGVQGMLNSQKKSGLLILKFIVLVAAFAYAFYALPKSFIFCVLSYIFQLIILALSIKRENKKN